MFTILSVSSIATKLAHLRAALKERNKGRIKAEIFFLTLIMVLGISLILLSGK
jgi:hypothetical protein